MAAKRTYIFSTLAILYFIGCAYGANAVSQSIADYIGQNGWDQFNFYAMIIGILLIVPFSILFGLRFWLKRPTYKEVLWGLLGLGFSYYILYDFVLLTTEYVHIPQFMILTVLLYMAFPKDHLIVFIIVSAGCIVDEWIQSWMPNRVLDINDIFLNFIGFYVGLLLWWCISIFFKEREPIEPQEAM